MRSTWFFRNDSDTSIWLLKCSCPIHWWSFPDEMRINWELYFLFLSFYRPLGYSPFLQGMGWVMEMFLQWIAELVVESLWCVGIKISSLGKPFDVTEEWAFFGEVVECANISYSHLSGTQKTKESYHIQHGFPTFSLIFLNLILLISPSLSLLDH